MASTRFHDLLDDRLTRAEMRRAAGTGGSMLAAILLGSALVLMGVEGPSGGPIVIDEILPGLLSGATLAIGELLIAASLWRRIQQGERVPAGLSWVLVTIENLFPVVFMASLAGGPLIGVMLDSPVVFAFGTPTALSALRLDPKLSLWAGVVAGGGYLAFALWTLSAAPDLVAPAALHVMRAFFMLSAGVAAAAVAASLRSSFGQAAEALEERNWVVGVFGRYVTDEVVDVLLKSPDGLALGGEQREVTVLMTDLRGFSKLAARLPAPDVVRLLNHYLGAMTDVIQGHGGTIDEFIRDAILVVFNAPLDQADHPRAALACAIDMQRAMPVVNAWNAAQGLPAIEMGIGVHTGRVVVGNIGSEKRQKYGVVGAAVNLTARVEGYTVGGQVLTTAVTAERAGPRLMRGAQRTVHPKGTDAPIQIIDVRGLGDAILPESHDELVPIAPLPVAWRRIEGKDLSGPEVEGEIVALADHAAVLRAAAAPPVYTDLCVRPGAGQLFGKVVSHGEAGEFTLRFTAHDAAAEEALAAAAMATRER
jgi:class 3 adenylate cyclase